MTQRTMAAEMGTNIPNDVTEEEIEGYFNEWFGLALNPLDNPPQVETDDGEETKEEIDF